MLRVLSAAFLLNAGLSAWSAILVGYLVRAGASSGELGVLYAQSELMRLPALLALPMLVRRWGPTRLVRLGLLVLCVLPGLVLTDPGPERMRLAFVLGAVPSLAA